MIDKDNINYRNRRPETNRGLSESEAIALASTVRSFGDPRLGDRSLPSNLYGRNYDNNNKSEETS